MSDKCLHLCFSKEVDNLLAAGISLSERALLLHHGSDSLTVPAHCRLLWGCTSMSNWGWKTASP